MILAAKINKIYLDIFNFFRISGDQVQNLNKILLYLFILFSTHKNPIKPMEKTTVKFIDQTSPHKYKNPWDAPKQYKKLIKLIQETSCIQEEPFLFVYQAISEQNLNLSYCKIIPNILDRILNAFAEFLPYIRTISLCQCKLNHLPNTFYIIQQNKKFHCLKHIDLRGNNFNTEEKKKIKNKFAGIKIDFD